MAYVPASGTDDIWVVDTATHLVTATIPTGMYPLGVATFPSAHRAYVTNSNSDTVSVIDTFSSSVLTVIAVPTVPPAPLSIPADITINVSGTRLYIALGGTNQVAEIDTTTNSVIRRFNVGMAPTGVAVNRAGDTLYVSNQNADNVSVIDVATGELQATIHTNEKPLFITISPSGRQAFVTSAAAHSITVIDTQTNQVERVLSIPERALQLVFKPDGTRLYVVGEAGSADSVIEVFDGLTLDRLAPIPTESSPYGIDVTPEGRQLFVPCAATNHVMIFDTNDSHLVDVVTVGKNPFVYGRFIGGAAAAAEPAAEVPLSPCLTMSLGLLLCRCRSADVRFDAGSIDQTSIWPKSHMARTPINAQSFRSASTLRACRQTVFSRTATSCSSTQMRICYR